MRKIDDTLISSDLLRTFLAVAAVGNVTQAASTIGRTQSATSLQIQKLEAALSVQLFERGSRGVLLTEHGKKLLPAARRALEEIDRVGALFSDPLAGRVRVGIPDDYNETILEKALASFSARHRDVEVFVRSGCTAGFPDAIRRQELDLAIYSAGTMDRDKTFFSEPTVWAASAEFTLSRNEPVPLALFDRDCRWREVPTEALDRADRAWRLAYLSENFTSVKAAIAAGLAVGILAKSALEGSMRVLGQRSGFPALPNTCLSLLKREDRSDQVVDEMEKAIREAIPRAAELGAP
ncbi:MAG: LysR substrate-binding domain-containing protein [Pseudomonadota bacterium]